MKHLTLALLLLITGQSFSQVAKRGRKFVITQTTSATATAPTSSTPGGNTVTIQVTFSTAPASPTANIATLKYDKKATFEFEVDDGLAVVDNVFKLFNGGTVVSEGVTYSGLTHTDGAGNAVKYRGALALNARSSFNNGDLWNNVSGRSSTSTIAGYVNADWGLENHSYYHGNNTGNNFSWSNAGQDINEETKYIYTKLLTQSIEYVTTTHIVPSAYVGYVKAADSLGFFAASSQGAKDTYTIYPTNTNTQFATEETLPAGFVILGRNFQDTYSTANMNTLNTQIDNLIAGSSSTVHNYMRLGTHTASWPAIKSVFMHLDSVNLDRVWVTSMPEHFDYRRTKQAVIKSQSLAGNVLTITLDYTGVNPLVRFRDLSLLVGGGTVSSVSVSGADRFSYNAATGLVNVFKRKTTGFPVPQ